MCLPKFQPSRYYRLLDYRVSVHLMPSKSHAWKAPAPSGAAWIEGLGRVSDGLPLSIQFVGKHLSEPLLCRIGNKIEQNAPWHQLRPRME